MLGEGASVTEIERIRTEAGLDRPLLEQHPRYMSGLVRGDLGVSFRNQGSVPASVIARYPATLQLASAGLLLSLIFAIPLGVISAVRRGRLTDRLVGVVSLFGISFPVFASGPLLVLIFSIGLGLLPVSGRGGLEYLILPATTLGATLAAITVRMVRSSMLEEIQQDYVRTARAKGLSERVVLYQHALRNGLIPVITILG